MKTQMISFCLSFLIVLLGLELFAQESPLPSAEPVQQVFGVEPNYAKTLDEAKALGPKNKEFFEKSDHYKEIAKKMRAMKIEAHIAKQEREKEINEQYPKLYEEGLAMSKELVAIALDAFDEAPNRNPDVNVYLRNFIGWEYERDNHEEAVRIFKRLVAKGIDKTILEVYIFAGFSALMSMDFDNAEAWIKVAGESKILEKYFTEMAKTEKGRKRVRSLQGMYLSIPALRESWKKEQEIRKAEAEAGEQDATKKLPRVLLKTTKGDIVVELFEDQAPNTVANFISLVEKGFYNKTPFHRVLPQFMAQGGDPTGTGGGGPGYCIDCECKKPDYRKHFRGSLSMAKAAAPNTGGSQFFLTFVPTSFLDEGHTVFGRVVEGLEILAEIQRFDPDEKDAIVPDFDRIVEAKVLNKRDHVYEPVKNRMR